MAKEKKIGFSYSLYKRAKPEINEKGEPQYPLYVKVIFNQKSTRFPFYVQSSDYKKYFSLSEREFEEELYTYNEEMDANLSTFIERRFKNIIRHEYSIFEDSYRITGIMDRFQKYSMSLIDIVENEFRIRIFDQLGDHFTYNEFKRLKKISKMKSYESKEDFNALLIELSQIFEEKGKIPDYAYNEILQEIELFVEILAFNNFYSIPTLPRNLNLYAWIVDKKSRTEFISYLQSKERAKNIRESILVFNEFTHFIKGIDTKKRSKSDGTMICERINKVVQKSKILNEIYESIRNPK